jgi:hypothetical protein
LAFGPRQSEKPNRSISTTIAPPTKVMWKTSWKWNRCFVTGFCKLDWLIDVKVSTPLLTFTFKASGPTFLLGRTNP